MVGPCGISFTVGGRGVEESGLGPVLSVCLPSCGHAARVMVIPPEKFNMEESALTTFDRRAHFSAPFFWRPFFFGALFFWRPFFFDALLF